MILVSLQIGPCSHVGSIPLYRSTAIVDLMLLDGSQIRRSMDAVASMRLSQRMQQSAGVLRHPRLE